MNTNSTTIKSSTIIALTHHTRILSSCKNNSKSTNTPKNTPWRSAGRTRYAGSCDFKKRDRAPYPTRAAVAETAKKMERKNRINANEAVDDSGSTHIIMSASIPHESNMVARVPIIKDRTVIFSGPDGSRTRCLLRDRETCKTVTLQAQYMYLQYRICR